MIAALGKIWPTQIVEGAISLSQGVGACHEYSTKRFHTDQCGIRHNDGWGAVYVNQNKELECVKGFHRIDQDANVVSLRGITTSALVIHVRNASLKEQQGIRFVHPIERKVNNRPAFFFHNGFAPEIFRLLGYERSKWDSEELCDWLLPALCSQNQRAIEKMVNQLPKSTTAANFIFIHDKSIIVCNWFCESSTSPCYYTMSLLKTKDQLVIASDSVPEIAPSTEWRPIRNKTILIANLNDAF